MEAKEFHNSVVDVLTEVKFITGAPLYPISTPDQPGLEHQVAVIKRFLARTPRFLNLTKDEIAQAFYMNAGGYFSETYRHYNRELNTELLGDVLNAYIRWKDAHLGGKLGAIYRAIAPPAKTQPPVRGFRELIPEINHDLALVAAGHGALVFNIAEKYTFLRRMGYIRIRSRAHWWNWYQWGIRQKQYQTIRQTTTGLGQQIDKKQMLELLERILATGEIPPDQHHRLVHHTRRAIYIEHLQAFAEIGITNPFTQVSPL